MRYGRSARAGWGRGWSGTVEAISVILPSRGWLVVDEVGDLVAEKVKPRPLRCKK